MTDFNKCPKCKGVLNAGWFESDEMLELGRLVINPLAAIDALPRILGRNPVSRHLYGTAKQTMSGKVYYGDATGKRVICSSCKRKYVQCSCGKENEVAEFPKTYQYFLCGKCGENLIVE